MGLRELRGRRERGPQPGDGKGGGSIASGRAVATAFRRGWVVLWKRVAGALVKTFTIALAEDRRVATVRGG